MSQPTGPLWQHMRGRVKLNFDWNATDCDSTVLTTKSEYCLDGMLPDSPDHHRFVGDANVTVSRITAHGPADPNHGVTFVVQIDWENPVNIVTDITVLDKPVGIEPASDTGEG